MGEFAIEAHTSSVHQICCYFCASKIEGKKYFVSPFLLFPIQDMYFSPPLIPFRKTADNDLCQKIISCYHYFATVVDVLQLVHRTFVEV